MYENSTEMIEKWTDIFEISSNKYCNFGYIRKNCPSKISSGLQFKIEGVLHPSQLAQSVFFLCSGAAEHYLSTFLNSKQYLSAQNWALYLNYGRSEHLGLSTFFKFRQNWALRCGHRFLNTPWLGTKLDLSHILALWTEHLLKFYKIWAPWTEHFFTFFNTWELISEHSSKLKKKYLSTFFCWKSDILAKKKLCARPSVT